MGGLFGVTGINLNAFPLCEFIQQRVTSARVGGDQGGACQIDDADHLLRGLQRPRFHFGCPENLQPRQMRDDQQCGNQQHAAPEQRARPQRHCALPSGMNT